MNKYLNLILLFSILISGCVRHNQINFSSSEDFFSSLNEKKEIAKKQINNKKDEEKTKLSLTLTLSSYEKKLREKFGFDEITILNKFVNPNLQINHGKIKNLQYHLKSCYLDLFFLNEYEIFKFRHYDIRPSSITSTLNKKDCVKQLNSKFILIPGPK